MGKYDPLGEYLRRQRKDLVPMSFRDIEKLIGSRLPRSRRYPAWWSNNPWNNVMTKVWLEAGYVTEQVDVAGEKIVFRRVTNPRSKPPADHPSSAPATVPQSVDHPLYGWLKGTVQIPPDVDLTQPADPDWGKSTNE